MSYQSRTPSSKLTLDKDGFNQLISILDFNINSKIEDNNFSNNALKLKDKLLKYSVSRTNDNNEDYIDVRFFPSEASEMIWQLLIHAPKTNIVNDYYMSLIENRKKGD